MCSSIVDVNTTSDRLIIEQLEHEITQKDREREREGLWGQKMERQSDIRVQGEKLQNRQKRYTKDK